MTWTRRPAAAFYASTEINADWSNWWGPNPPAVLGMLRARALATSDTWDSATWPASCEGGLQLGNVAHSRLARGRAPLPWGYTQTDRGIFHAYR